MFVLTQSDTRRGSKYNGSALTWDAAAARPRKATRYIAFEVQRTPFPRHSLPVPAGLEFRQGTNRPPCLNFEIRPPSARFAVDNNRFSSTVRG
jgi:hypothetical protein